MGLVSRFGQFYKAVDPGLVQVNVCTESLRIVDVKIQISAIGRQTVITRDNVNVEMCVQPSVLCCFDLVRMMLTRMASYHRARSRLTVTR